MYRNLPSCAPGAQMSAGQRLSLALANLQSFLRGEGVKRSAVLQGRLRDDIRTVSAPDVARIVIRQRCLTCLAVSRIPRTRPRLVSLATTSAELRGAQWPRAIPQRAETTVVSRGPIVKEARRISIVAASVTVLALGTAAAQAQAAATPLAVDVNAQLDTATGSQDATVTATAVARVGTGLTGCPSVTLTLTLVGAQVLGPPQTSQDAPFDASGVARLTSQFVVELQDGQQVVTIEANAQCPAGASASSVDAFPAQISIPAVTETDVTGAPIPAPDPSYGMFSLLALRDDLRTSARSPALAAVLSCAPHLGPRGSAPFARALCKEMATVALASLAVAYARPRSDVLTIAPATFPKTQVQLPPLVFTRCSPAHGRVAEGLRTTCSRIADAARRWGKDEGEIEWLLRSAAAAMGRAEGAAQLGMTAAEGVQYGVLQVYFAQLSQAVDDQEVADGTIGHAIAETRLDMHFSTQFLRHAVKLFRSARDVPAGAEAAVRGLVAAPRTLAAHISARLETPPPLLSALFYDIRTFDVPTAEEAVPPSIEVQLLQAWLGSAAAGLENLCGDQFAQEIASLESMPTATYATVLAHTLITQFDNGRECIPGQTYATFTVGAIPFLLASPFAQVIASDAPHGLEAAFDFTVAPDGTLLVADSEAQVIDRYSAQGAYLGSIGAGRLTTPGEVATDPAGHIYVSDFDMSRIDRFGPDGTFQMSWGVMGTGPGQFDRPTGLAWAPSGELVVADASSTPGAGGNGRLEAFDSNGTFLWATSGAPGTPAYLQRPRGLAVSPDGTIAVAEATTDAPRVVLFGPNGAYEGQTDSSLGLIQPYGVAFDPSGHLWIADRDSTALVELNSLDSIASQYENYGPEDATLDPVALAFTPTATLVLDFAGQRIVAFPTAALP